MRPIIFLLLLFTLIAASNEAILIQRSPGSNRINVRLQVPAPGEGITFTALLPQADCLTEEPTENRLMLDLPGCRLSLDWSNSLFGTTHYFRKGAKPAARRVRRKWRVGPVQKLKVGSAIMHYGNNMRVQLNDNGVITTSVAPNGAVMGPQQRKVFSCPLGLANTGGLLDMDLFSPAGTAKCQIGIEFGPEYKLLGSEEMANNNAGEELDPKEAALERESMRD